MNPRNLFEGLRTDDRGVSPVVGVALLIAIAVILATVIGLVVLGIGPGASSAPQAQLDITYDGGNETYTVKHRGGDALPEDEVYLIDNGTKEALSSDLTAGNSADVTVSGATGEVTVVWEDPNSDSSTVIAEFEA